MTTTVLFLLVVLQGRMAPEVMVMPNQAECRKQAKEGTGFMKGPAYCVPLEMETKK